MHPTVRLVVSQLLAATYDSCGADPDMDPWRLSKPTTPALAVSRPWNLVQIKYAADLTPPPLASGPLGAAALRSLRIFPLLSDARLSASQLQAQNTTHIGQALDHYLSAGWIYDPFGRRGI